MVFLNIDSDCTEETEFKVTPCIHHFNANMVCAPSALCVTLSSAANHCALF